MLLLILLSIVAIAISGMFYWMYKSRKGELNLSKKSWHFKLIHWMWDVSYREIRNACPYYWSLVFSILILPLYLIGRYIFQYIFIGISKFSKWLYNKLPENESKINLPKINLPKLPTPSESYKKIYKKGKQWTEYIFFGLLILIVLGSTIFGFIMSFVFNFIFGITLLSVFIFVILTYIISKLFPQLDEYHINHYKNLFDGLWGIVKLPFVIIFGLVRLIGNKISNSCPPINWN